MDVLMIINGPAYGADATYNAVRLAASLAGRENVTMRVFLMGDVVGQVPGRDLREVAVGVGQEAGRGEAQLAGGRGELVGPQPVQVARYAVQGGRLATGQAQHVDRCPTLDEPGEHGAEAERLVVGMGDDREHRGPVGEVGAGPAPHAAPTATGSPARCHSSTPASSRSARTPASRSRCTACAARTQ